MKRESPVRIVFLASVFVALAIGGLTMLLMGWLHGRVLWVEWASITLLAIPVAYGIFYYVVKRFLYDRIRLIYKTIHRMKTRKGTAPAIDMQSDVLGNVHREVREWEENTVQEIQRLRDQEAFRRQFIGNLAHELKTPIFSIQGHILTLLDGALEDEEHNRVFLRKAAKGVERMTNILSDLDTVTRIEDGRLALEMERVDIVRLAGELIESLDIKARERDIGIRIKEGHKGPVVVNCDKKRIEQVLTNLISNSISYGVSGGMTELRFYDMDEHILVEVADDGVGIPESEIPRLFERFYRVDKSRSRNEGGTGLGLAIVKHIIDAHGQSINVRSQEEVGSTFSFTLEKAR